MSEDLTTRIAGLAAAIEERLGEDETTAHAAAGPVEGGTHWHITRQGTLDSRAISGDTSVGCPDGCHPSDAQNAHVARNDPARVLRRVAVTRSLVGTILAESHDWIPGDEYYSCSQAVDPYEDDPSERYPGSGCANPERTGQPCDCGRDQRVARLLGIIATEWEEK